MKKHTRFLAMLMTLVMTLNCFCGLTVFAEENTGIDVGSVTPATDGGTSSSDCPDHTNWTKLTNDNIAENMFLYDQHWYLNKSGSYYLGEDLQMGVTMYIWPGDTVNLCLNGYDIEMVNSNRTILNPKNGATLNLYDCGTQVRYYDENGWVTIAGVAWDEATDEQKAAWDTATDAQKDAAVAAAVAAGTNPIEVIGGAIYGASSYDQGGAGVFIQVDAEFNMYGGNILGCSSSVTGHWGGGVYNYQGTFNMYNGVIAYNSSYTYAGGLFIRTGSTVNMYGGEIAYNYAPTSGAGVYSGGEFTMYGDASIHDNYGSTTGSGFYNAGGGTLTMTENSSIYNNVSGDGGGAGVYMPSYNSILNMSGTSSITGNYSTGIAPGVNLISGVMTISDDAKVSGNYVVESVEIVDSTTTTNANGVALKMLGDVGDKVVDSNVYLSNGKTITFDNYDGNAVYVTSANGLGLVATSVDNSEDSGNLSSDVTSYYAVRETNNTEVHLVEADILDGKTATKTYASGTIDLSDLRMFDVISSDTTYTITGGTGVGTNDGKALSVDSIGTFIIEAVTPASNAYPLTTQTSTLTVEPATVTITGIGTIGSVVGTTVELDNTSGTIVGDVNDDDVSIDFSVAYGVINDESYSSGATDTFDVDIYGISLTGEDAGNYTLGTVNNGDGTSVTISATIPHVSWPTAQDIVYGDDRSNDDLIGGTVVVQTGTINNYVYTTVTGNFEWVSTAVDAAGTHTYEVQFDVTGTYSTEITEAVETLTHNVTQVVQPAEVTFSIGDSIIDDANEVVNDLAVSTTPTISDYILWYCDVNDGSWTKDVPTEAGSYLLGAEFTSDNYHHAGTQESTAKQIGAFVIGSSATAYTLTFVNDDDETVHETITAIPQTIHILPTLTDTTENGSPKYTGWEDEDGTIYDFGSRFAQPAENVTLTAVAANANATLSGTITGTDLTGTSGNLEGVVVTLMQGAEQVAVTTTTSVGTYEFEVPQGRYNVVVTRDQVIRNEETVYVNLDSTAKTVDVEIPDIRQNTIFNVASGMTAITVYGMENLMDDDEVRSVKVELNPSSDTAAILALAATNNLTADNAKFYIDLSIQQRGENDASYGEKDLEDTEKLTFYIPLAGLYQGYGNYSVYFDDGSSVVELTSSEATVSASGDLLTLTTQKSGVYGLAFWNTPTTLVDIEDIAVEYTTTGIDLNDLGLFILPGGISTISDIEDITYVITSGNDDGDGVGTIEDNLLYVTAVGEFDILISFVVGSTSYVGTATLTVDPKTVTISGITCVDQEVTDITDDKVPLNTGGLLSGVETGDSVQIDFDDAVGKIAEDYAENETLTTTGINTFDVAVTGLALTGTDAGNYTISTDPAPTSKVTVNMSIAYIAWPTAHDIVYGDPSATATLYGGKVVVAETKSNDTDSTYTDITDKGEFQWVTDLIAVDAGSYTYAVKFVENPEHTYAGESSYQTTLAATTQDVTLVVQPAAVTFAIEDSTLAVGDALSISVTDEFGQTLNEDYYSYLYYVDDEWVSEAPTDPGSYLIGASVTSNYRHAGTQEGTAKQIGAFTIGDADPDTYTVTFTDFTENNITGALYQAIHILPTLDDVLEDGSAKYIGWEDEDGITYDFGERFPQPEKDVTFTAIEAPAKDKTISGTITGTDLNGLEGGLSRVGVALYQGSTLVDYGETATGEDNTTIGTYSFDVAPGVYNLVVTRDLGTAAEITVFVDTTEESVVADFELPDVIQNAVLEVATGLPDLVVEGLTALAETGTADGTLDSEFLLEITSNTTTDADIVTKIVNTAAAAGIDADEIKQFFNVDLSSKIGDAASFRSITEASSLLTFYIPLTGIYQGHDEYTVYRYHDGQVQVLNTTPNNDGEYIEVSDNNLIIHAKFFSLYGIAFDNETIVATTTTTYYTPTLTAGDNGSLDSVSPSRAAKGTKVTITPTPDDGYVVDTVTVTSSTGTTYTVTDNGDGTYSFTQPGASVTVAVTFAEEAPATSALPFTDVSVDDWFYEDVLYLYELGLMSGTSATTFSPYSGNTRAMVAQMMYNLEGQPERTEFGFFSDVVEGQWYEPAVNWCASYGVVDGYPDGLYRPDTIISRQQFASVLYDHCLHLGYDVSELNDLSSFVDSPSEWATTYVMWAVQAEILQGTTAGYLNGSDQLTRCEAAAMFARFLRNVYES